MEQSIRHKARTRKIIFTDVKSFIFLTLSSSGFFTGPFILLISLIYLIFIYQNVKFSDILILTFVIGVVSIPFLLMGLFSLPFLMRRINKIKNIIKNGEITKGTITKIISFKSTSIYFDFTVGDKLYEARVLVSVFKLPFNKGDVVDVCYNKDNPSEALITQFFADETPSS